ncbi:hypothetical protein T552_02680 [Pneumocystis carinii B80]|uniref:S1 motif domain-containing protein n=1 Tax=Pneumocystis carinii (strain B80) TaxID=1408658 RepID=A0A0W4ZE69_PNEC8|nr:hypothetical protein T552_02680 [Pneumocystis carinii B80]KTW26671.1 hypothetical protein T552_02680 [Pneumocystis carinii B80]
MKKFIEAGKLALPGQPVSSTNAAIAGPGTIIYNSVIRASIPGKVVQSLNLNGEYQVSVERLICRFSGKGSPILPEVNAFVLGRVIKIKPKEAIVSIFVVNEIVCQREFQGIIRIQDIEAVNKNTIKVYTSFRLGDIVRAQVISLGDQYSYYLSTAKNDLGVVFATDITGDTMYPINWHQMRSYVTGTIEERKCARPI